uniref:Uncharacterized protein n=1 Tax=Callorhinchus milii TaxID=7868 RepID=A0A4W3HRI8_CALMI
MVWDELVRAVGLDHSTGRAYLLGATLVLALTVVGSAILRFLCMVHGFWVNTKRLRCFQGPPPRNWLMGHLGLICSSEEGLTMVNGIVERYVHCCLTWFGPIYPIVRLFHPDYIKCVLLASAPVALKDELFYGFLRPWLGEKFIPAKGWRWTRSKELATAQFTHSTAQLHTAQFTHSTAQLHTAQHSLHTAQRSLHTAQHSLHTAQYSLHTAQLTHSTVQLTHSTAYTHTAQLTHSTQHSTQRSTPHSLHAAHSIARRPAYAQYAAGGLHTARGSHAAHTQHSTPFARGGSWEAGHGADGAFSLQDEEGNGLTDEEIQSEADTFMFEGHDTTASAISWALYNLARHPEYQEKCREEIAQLLKENGSEDLEWDHLSQMPFTTMCIKESLRLHPAVTTVARSCTEDIRLPDGRIIPKGNICLISIYGTHHNPTVWPEPEVFNPARWSPTHSPSEPSVEFSPCSTSLRNCIGQNFAMAELKVAVALTLHRFRLKLEPTAVVRRKPELILRTERGIWLQLEPLGARASAEREPEPSVE